MILMKIKAKVVILTMKENEYGQIKTTGNLLNLYSIIFNYWTLQSLPNVSAGNNSLENSRGY